MGTLFGIAIGIVLGGFAVAFYSGAKTRERETEAFDAGRKSAEALILGAHELLQCSAKVRENPICRASWEEDRVEWVKQFGAWGAAEPGDCPDEVPPRPSAEQIAAARSIVASGGDCMGKPLIGSCCNGCPFLDADCDVTDAENLARARAFLAAHDIPVEEAAS